MSQPIELSVLFVCLGNICRSTMAEGTFRHHLEHTYKNKPESKYTLSIDRIDSCGTGAYHVGSAPDRRTIAVLKSHGITTYRHKARKLRSSDFTDYDYIFPMDDSNFEDVMDERSRVLKLRGDTPKKGASTAVSGGTPTVLGKAEDGLARVMLFGAFAGGRDEQEIVDDPYYGGDDGFETAFEQVDRFSKNFLAWLERSAEA